MKRFSSRFFTRRLCVSLFCISLLSQTSVPAQSSPVRTLTILPSPINLDFEQGNIGKVPDGWIAPPMIVGYSAEISEEKPKAGKRAALLRSSDVSEAASGEFGNLMQAIDGARFRGHRVRFRAAVRFEAAGQMSRAQMWMRVDRAANQVGFFDNMGDRPIMTPEWNYYEIIGDIDDDAAALNIGIILLGKGKAWIDDVSVEDMGKLVALSEPARALKGRGLENLTAFARLFGYVRHFHPSDQAEAADWDVLAVEGVRAIEDAQSSAELAQKLEAFFAPIAPSLRVFPTAKRPDLSREYLQPKLADQLKIVFYRHNGFGQKSGQGIYTTERVRLDSLAARKETNLPDPAKPLVGDLPGGVSFLMPLALYADSEGTLPRASAARKDAANSLVKYSGNDRATRLADVALAWNIFQHFYPYFDVVKTNWPKVLTDSLIAAATDADEIAFRRTLRLMVAALHDGHGGVYNSSENMTHWLPVIFEWIEDRLVITDVAADRAAGLKPGDIVLKIDGKDADKTLSEAEMLISGATPQWQRYIALRRLRSGGKDEVVRLEVRSAGGSPRMVELRRDAQSVELKEKRPEKTAEIKQGIFYLDLDRINDEDFNALLPKLEKANGIIFDLRGYPKVSAVVISHLIDKPVESARWLVPIVTLPDQKGVEFNTNSRWSLDPIAPRLRARIAFITDGRAISYAETYMGIIEAYKLASIVGETTAGTNGNINPVTLPGGYRVVWTGMKVLKHDGSQHHGIGIRPTIPSSRTIKGVAEGRDEQLEKAIEVVSK
jgi:C-terminal processing protease CtpA/Prc